MEVNLETKKISVPNESSDSDGNNIQLDPGTRLVNRYLIQEVIGIGGMGSVYRARDLHFPNVVKLVAVKEMINHAPDPLIRKTIVQNFEREANILATLNQPSIPRIYDYFTEGDRSYLVIEFVNGKDLEAIINETDGFLPQEKVVQWGLELCDVLTFLHSHKPDPIIFRDMKPSNIMVNQQERIVLVDFGIAKQFQTGQKGTMIGTEGYSPPEQYRGEATHLADIYSLGATLHHALTRRDPRLEPPFSFAERPIRKINPEVSPELEAIITTALKYDPAERYQSTDEMKNALLGFLRKPGVLNRTGSVLSPIPPGGLKPLWTFQCEDEIRSSPVQYEGAIYFGSYDNNLYSLNITNGEFLWKYPTEGGISSRPAPYDGNVYFGSGDHRLHVVNSRSGKVVWTYYTNGRIYSSPRIAENHAFIGSDDNYLHAVNLISGRASWKFEAAAPVRSTPFINNDAVFTGCESGEFYCVDFRGELKWRFKAKLAVTSSPLVMNGIVYFTSLDSSLYALDARAGWVIWRFRMGKGSIASPCFAEDMVFAGAADGVVYAIEAKTAKEIWRFQAEHQISGSPVTYRDSVYFGSADGYLYCLEFRTGRLRWKFKTEGAITSTPLVYDDVVYIGSTDHMLYALLA